MMNAKINLHQCVIFIKPVAIRKAKNPKSFGLPECNRVRPRKFDTANINCLI